MAGWMPLVGDSLANWPFLEVQSMAWLVFMTFSFWVMSPEIGEQDGS
jgi:hypothetical protein